MAKEKPAKKEAVKAVQELTTKCDCIDPVTKGEVTDAMDDLIKKLKKRICTREADGKDTTDLVEDKESAERALAILVGIDTCKPPKK